MISEERVEKAVEFLRDTAQRYGELRGHQAYCDASLRRIKSLQMLEITEGSLGEREAKAYASKAYHHVLMDLEDSTALVETLRAQREAAIYTIEIWRSQSSARKQGIIT
jgi:hypothetical protein